MTKKIENLYDKNNNEEYFDFYIKASVTKQYTFY